MNEREEEKKKCEVKYAESSIASAIVNKSVIRKGEWKWREKKKEKGKRKRRGIGLSE